MKKSLVVSSALAILIIGGALLYIMRDRIGTPIDSTQSMINSSQQSLLASIPKSTTEETLEGYTGDEFDRFFIANMIAHHQGAVDMANIALMNAKHQELKDMANGIVTAQTKEISNMQSWQKDWGYPASGGEMMEDHSAMGMMGEMAAMTEKLKGLTGDDFDKAFISSMIEHHKSAVAMARPGEKNAGHKEVKELSMAIINDQTKEISKMQKWQMDWGYVSGDNPMPGMNH